MTSDRNPRRPRRIAADEAHAWARNLRLGNSLAKLVLSMITGYVNGEGSCFVSIEALSEDTELSADTVRRRLAWLESIGALARMPQWVDANGRRNSEGKGKRTSDEIRLLLNADIAVIEAAAIGKSEEFSPSHQQGQSQRIDVISPSTQQGLDGGQDSVSPRPALALRQGPDSLNREPEVEPPNPPSGGGQDVQLDQDLTEFAASYPAPITNLPRLRTVLAAMSPYERRKIVLAAKGYAAYIADLDKRGKKRAVKDADRWVAAGMWQGYVAAAERVQKASHIQRMPNDSEVGKAWKVLHKIARSSPIESQGAVLVTRLLSPQARACARAPPEDEWVFVSADNVNQAGAWREFLADALAGVARPELVREHRAGRGFFAPWGWPPRRDGTVSTTGPPDVLMTEDDARYLSENE